MIKTKKSNLWLVSPAFNATELEKVVFSFNYRFYDGEDIDLEMFYTDKIAVNSGETDWSSLGKTVSVNDHIWGNSGEITIANPPDTLFIGIQYKAAGRRHQQAFIDNLKVNDRLTSSKITLSPKNHFKIYPNPVNDESVVSFIQETSGKVKLSLFDIHGRKISTILNKELPQGHQSIPIRNYIQGNGVYFCQLSTNTGISTIKLIVDKL